jgi:hypothetical protein
MSMPWGSGAKMVVVYRRVAVRKVRMYERMMGV